MTINHSETQVAQLKQAIADGTLELLRSKGYSERTREELQKRFEAEAPARFEKIFAEILSAVKRAHSLELPFSDTVPLMLVEEYEYSDCARISEGCGVLPDSSKLKLAARQVFDCLSKSGLKPSLQWRQIQSASSSDLFLHIVFTRRPRPLFGDM